VSPARSHEGRVVALTVLAAAVPAAVALPLLWLGDFDAKTRWTLTLVIGAVAFGCALAVRARVARPLQTLANLIASVREGDYSVRGRHARRDDALGEAMTEINALSIALRRQRHDDVEAAAALSTVIAGLDAAVMVFDGGGVMRLANRSAERLLGRAAGSLVGRTATELALDDLVGGVAPRTAELPAFGRGGPWDVRRGQIRLEGRPHQLLVLTDVQRALREEERQAWQRLVRVLGHEINNSLGPIQSIAGTLRAGLSRPTRAADFDEDLERGLAVIERRSAALGRFMASYAQLARLPAPRLGTVEVAAWVRRTVELEARLAGAVTVEDGPPETIAGDGDQLDQLLINVIANAVEAAAETGGGVRVRWQAEPSAVSVVIEDDGPGLPPAANLFVPFFTTKPTGSGIGLVLSRQIAEAHGGRLTLVNRGDGARGCRATIWLPRRATQGA
jgi:nitrogen fixation/metabolism regulation signal transduction histidine kinase